MEYLSNHLLYPTQISNLSLDYKKNYNSLNWRQPLMEDDLKISKGEYLSNRCMDQTSEENLEENSEENSEEISSVALLSPACFWN